MALFEYPLQRSLETVWIVARSRDESGPSGCTAEHIDPSAGADIRFRAIPHSG